jgi:hypothetical protein
MLASEMNFESLVQTATLSVAIAIEAIVGGLIALAVAQRAELRAACGVHRASPTVPK